jgi:hypothetical protein
MLDGDVDDVAFVLSWAVILDAARDLDAAAWLAWVRA